MLPEGPLQPQNSVILQQISISEELSHKRGHGLTHLARKGRASMSEVGILEGDSFCLSQKEKRNQST